MLPTKASRNQYKFHHLSNDVFIDLYLMPFGPLRSQFRGSELNNWISFMVEKGIRLRKDIAPYISHWKEDVYEDTRVDEVEMDEQEQRAVEYRRLLPYK